MEFMITLMGSRRRDAGDSISDDPPAEQRTSEVSMFLESSINPKGEDPLERWFMSWRSLSTGFNLYAREHVLIR